MFVRMARPVKAAARPSDAGRLLAGPAQPARKPCQDPAFLRLARISRTRPKATAGTAPAMPRVSGALLSSGRGAGGTGAAAGVVAEAVAASAGAEAVVAG
jgi:hypothetical protein